METTFEWMGTTRSLLDSFWNDDYSYFEIIETPNESEDGWLRYITYDAYGNALTFSSVDYDWAVDYHFN